MVIIMKRKKLIALICFSVILVVLIVAFVFSVISKKKNNINSPSTFSTYGWFGNDLALLWDQNKTNVMCAHDLTSGKSTVLCGQPDCKHQTFEENSNTKCTAVPPADYYWVYAFYYNDKIYEVFDATNKFVIYSAEKDGTNRKEFVSSDEYQADYAATDYTVLCGDNLIFPAQNVQTDEEGNDVKTTKVLLNVNLTDKTVNKVVDLTDLPSFDYWGLYMYDDIVYCQLRFKDVNNKIVYSCENGELNEVYSDNLMEPCSFGKDGFWFSKYKSENDYSTDCIMFYSISDKSVEKYCDADGYVYTILNDENGIFYCTDSSPDNTYDINNVRTIYYSDKKKTKVCLKSTDEKYWTPWYTAGDRILLLEGGNNGSWGANAQYMSVKTEDLKNSGVDKAVYINRDVIDVKSSDTLVD